MDEGGREPFGNIQCICRVASFYIAEGKTEVPAAMALVRPTRVEGNYGNVDCGLFSTFLYKRKKKSGIQIG